MKKVIFLFLLLSARQIALAQNNYDLTWALGWGNMNMDSVKRGVNVLFTKNGTIVNSVKRGIKIDEPNATVNDKHGNLLFYTNGCAIYNKYDILMHNGDSLGIGSIIQDPWCLEDKYLPALPQSRLFLPLNDSIYYLLHEQEDTVDFWGIVNKELLYTKVNVKANGGQGLVLEKNKRLIAGLFDTGHLTCVKQANNKDWWITFWKHEKPEYYVIPFTSDGFGKPQLKKTDAIVIDINHGGGAANFSPDGKKYARYDKRLLEIQLFGFDRAKGELYNYRQLSTDTILPSYLGSGYAAFSPNSKYLYITDEMFAYQFDTEAADIQASKVVIATRKETLSNRFIAMQMGADCKIYMTSSSGAYFHVIEKPNEKGAACSFKYRDLKLPISLPNALPYFPNFRLGTKDEHWCDSLRVDTKDNITEPLLTCAVYPNPAAHQVNIDLFGYVQHYKKGNWELYNTMGQLVATFPILAGHDEYNFDISFLSQGLYVWHLRIDEKTRQSGRLVKVE